MRSDTDTKNQVEQDDNAEHNSGQYCYRDQVSAYIGKMLRRNECCRVALLRSLCGLTARGQAFGRAASCLGFLFLNYGATGVTDAVSVDTLAAVASASC